MPRTHSASIGLTIRVEADTRKEAQVAALALLSEVAASLPVGVSLARGHYGPDGSLTCALYSPKRGA